MEGLKGEQGAISDNNSHTAVLDGEGRGRVNCSAVARRAPLEPGENITRGGQRLSGVAFSFLLVATTPYQRTLCIHLKDLLVREMKRNSCSFGLGVTQTATGLVSVLKTVIYL